MKEIVLNIDGMHCMGCVVAVEGALEDLEFIKEVQVDLNKKQVLIKYNEELDINKIKEVISKLGFKIVE